MEMLLLAGALPNFSSRLFSYVGPSLSPLVEYLTYCENYDYTLVRLLLQFGARVSFRPPTRLLKIRHPAGILSQVSVSSGSAIPLHTTQEAARLRWSVLCSTGIVNITPICYDAFT